MSDIIYNDKVYADCIHVNSSGGKMSFWGRLKFLFSNGNFNCRVEVYTENLPGNTASGNMVLYTATPSDWFPRKNVGMEAPMDEPEILEDGFVRFKGHA